MQRIEHPRQAHVQRIVLQTIQQILSDSGRTDVSVAEEQRLREDLGLDSLDLAVLVVRLEQDMGVDPFRKQRRAVRSVGDLVAIYEAELEANGDLR